VDEQLNKAPCGFLSFTDDGQIREVNATLLGLLGLAAEDALGAKLEDFFTISARIFHQTHLMPMLRLHGQAEEIFLTLQHKSRQSVPVLAYAIRHETGITDCVLVSVRQREKYETEILAAKQTAEEALRNNHQLQHAQAELLAQSKELERRIGAAEQSNRTLLQVTNILFHDLREPIRKIETFSKLLTQEEITPEDVSLGLSRIDAASARAAQLLRSLQQFVSVEAASDQRSLVHLNDVLSAAYAEVSQSYPECPADLQADDLPNVEGYARQLHLMFLHLFENAFTFRRGEAPLRIRITSSVVQHNRFKFLADRYGYVDVAQIYFSDNGTGIPDERRDSAFELLKNSGTAGLRSGCGLAICRKVAENHSGTISLDTSREGGATFKILLPLQQT
jgi:sigma-B regulation protein RsbU (phosphoserine phosphatase)